MPDEKTPFEQYIAISKTLEFLQEQLQRLERALLGRMDEQNARLLSTQERQEQQIQDHEDRINRLERGSAYFAAVLVIVILIVIIVFLLGFIWLRVQ